MSKKGEEYQKLVSLFAKALYPGAEVKYGQWLEGPDGKREIDVEIRGIIDGTKKFILIECKDWKYPVGIQEVDNLDSKRDDVKANVSFIASNSGFSDKALRKARRVGIFPISILVKDDKRIRFAINEIIYAKALSIDSWSLTIFPTDESNRIIENNWSPLELYFDEYPIVNWLSVFSKKLLKDYEGKSIIEATFVFKPNSVFKLKDKVIILKGFRLKAQCSKKWVYQQIGHDISLGGYDYLKKCIMVPSGQKWFIGPFDNEKWEEIKEKLEEVEERFISQNLQLTLFKNIKRVSSQDNILIDNIITEQAIKTN